MGYVAPLAGAWIEILLDSNGRLVESVAPLAGAWIEIYDVPHKYSKDLVAPLAGAWIEIDADIKQKQEELSRSPRGSVD